MVHPHFICLKCFHVFDLYSDFPPNHISLDNKAIDYEINIRGICEGCLKKEGEN